MCRRGGLESARRCGFEVPVAERSRTPQTRRVVWGRGPVAVEECPRSYIRAESVRWIEEFSVWKAGGVRDLIRLPARTAEAFFVLEQEWRAEVKNGREQHNQN